MSQSETFQVLISILQLIAAPGAAGYAASIAFDWLRKRHPRPTPAHWITLARWQQELTRWLHAPRYAFWSAKVIAFTFGVIGAFAAALAAYLAGGNAVLVLDQQVAVLLSGLLATLGSEWTHQARKKESW